ncbi:hypothetical protein DPMN_031401 [Dreissena polymorpha]|uniref:Uncharacterized protein n=2 Tax=Dreissena polymorpha TaxID=45954 RepID=A0A9D4RJA4_DREPO|nr:hypothetical protein DPMN_031401 [Dreissena polymorpha]
MMTSRPPLAGSQRDTCVAQGLELWCDAAQGWGQTPGVTQWCLLNCRENACDSTQCTCECVNELEFRARYNQLERSLSAVG